MMLPASNTVPPATDETGVMTGSVAGVAPVATAAMASAGGSETVQGSDGASACASAGTTGQGFFGTPAAPTGEGESSTELFDNSGGSWAASSAPLPVTSDAPAARDAAAILGTTEPAVASTGTNATTAA